MMIDIWILIAAGLIIVVSLGIGIRASERCSELEQDVDQLRHYSRKQEDVIVSLDKRVQSLEADIEKVKGEHQVHMTNISKILAENEHNADNFNRSIEKRMKELYDIVKRGNENHVSADKEELADIVDPENNDADSDEIPIIPVYRWIFPAEEPDHEKRLINGQSYTVIGVLKNQETTEIIVTREGFWDGHRFLTTDIDAFSTVYAYIRKPESADVMEKVLQMALAIKGLIDDAH